MTLLLRLSHLEHLWLQGDKSQRSQKRSKPRTRRSAIFIMNKYGSRQVSQNKVTMRCKREVMSYGVELHTIVGALMNKTQSIHIQ